MNMACTCCSLNVDTPVGKNKFAAASAQIFRDPWHVQYNVRCFECFGSVFQLMSAPQLWARSTTWSSAKSLLADIVFEILLLLLFLLLFVVLHASMHLSGLLILSASHFAVSARSNVPGCIRQSHASRSVSGCFSLLQHWTLPSHVTSFDLTIFLLECPLPSFCFVFSTWLQDKKRRGFESKQRRSQIPVPSRPTRASSQTR